MPELQKAHVAHPKGPSDNVCPLYVRLCFPVCGLCTLTQQGRNSSASHSALINISMSTVCMCTSLHSGNEMKEIQKRSILIHTYSVWKKGEKMYSIQQCAALNNSHKSKSMYNTKMKKHCAQHVWDQKHLIFTHWQVFCVSCLPLEGLFKRKVAYTVA